MKIVLKNINQSMNKAYLSQNPVANQIDLFKRNFTTFSKSINPTENEETLKDYINRFLNNTYFENRFAIKENENNIDLVLKTGKNINVKNTVIIETKAIKNTNEMITKDDINRKAFHETIQYYMEERVKRKNFEIKHIIVTNTIDWFIFDATEYERLFYADKQFLKNYTNWIEGKLVSKNKDWFYSEMAKPFIDTSEETIVCTYFNLQGFKNLEGLTDEKWIELYKIFSPEHLLKLPFQNDSNTLNTQFYNELLHIIRLHETKRKKIKTIERLPKNKQLEGSLIENTISILQSNDIINRIDEPERFGENKEEQLFSIGLELCIIWLNRVLFLKLLESQLIKYHKLSESSKLSESYRFLNSEKIQDFEQLNELFFEVLAVKQAQRNKFLQEKYANIPYLNSSIFEPNQIERETLYVNQLKSHKDLPVYPGTVLKDKKGKTIEGRKPILHYLFEFLDSYNFASTHKAEIQQTQKSIINSAVLGLIFEKINGYKEGSHFTPGFITMYMSRQTLRKAVINKFRPIVGMNYTTKLAAYQSKKPTKLSIH